MSTPRVMGVLNATPDSFSDGGRYVDVEVAVSHALQMIKDGAAIIDVGGESTRPGALEVSIEEECRRVVPVIETLSAQSNAIISIDSRKTEVMRAAIAAGASLVNDVNALQGPGALELVAESNVAVCLMHMQGQPETMQAAPHYDDVLADVHDFLQQRVSACVEAGIARERIMVDPGFGFGKTLAHNLQLLGRLQEFNSLNLPVLVGMSRKSMIAAVLGDPDAERLSGSLALASLAAFKGAAVIRAHDVAETVRAVRMVTAVKNETETT